MTVDYVTARALLVEGNPQAAMSAFMAGKIRVDGDLAKLMAVQGASPDAEPSPSPPRSATLDGLSPQQPAIAAAGTTSPGLVRGRGSGRGSGA